MGEQHEIKDLQGNVQAVDALKFLANKIVTSEHVTDDTLTTFVEAEKEAYTLLQKCLTQQEVATLTKKVVVLYDITKPMYYSLIQELDSKQQSHYMLGYDPEYLKDLTTEILKNALRVYMHDKVMETHYKVVEKLTTDLGNTLPKDSVNYTKELKIKYIIDVVNKVIASIKNEDTKDYTKYLKLLED